MSMSLSMPKANVIEYLKHYILETLTDVALDSLLFRDAVQLHHWRVSDHVKDVGEGLGPLAAE